MDNETRNLDKILMDLAEPSEEIQESDYDREKRLDEYCKG